MKKKTNRKGWEKCRGKRHKLVKVEKDESSKRVPMIQRMNCLSSHCSMCAGVYLCVCVCVTGVPQSAETKGVSLWHLLCPETWHTTRERCRERDGGLESTFCLWAGMCVRGCVWVRGWVSECLLLRLPASALCVNVRTLAETETVLYYESMSEHMNSPCAYFCARRWNVANHCALPGVCLGHTSEALTQILQSQRENGVVVWGVPQGSFYAVREQFKARNGSFFFCMHFSWVMKLL